MKVTSTSFWLEYRRLYIIMVVIYCCLKKRKQKVIKFHVNYSSYFEISAFLFQAPHLNTLKLNKHQEVLVRVNMLYL